MITYTRQPDGTFLQAGDFAAAPAEVRIKIGDSKPFSSTYTLAAAKGIIEDAIKKNQAPRDVYYILPMEEKIESAPKPSKQVSLTEEEETRVTEIAAGIEGDDAAKRKAAIKQLRKEQRDAGKPAKEPKAKKYSSDDFVRIYKETNSLDEVIKQTGASRVWAQRVLVKLGVYVKPVKEVKPEVVLTPEEEARVAEITAAQPVVEGASAELVRKNSIKQMRSEQRKAARPAKEPKGPRVTKYSKQDFVDAYQANHSLDEVCTKTGASRVWAQRVLVKLGVWVVPVKAEKPAAAPKEPKAAQPKPEKTPKAPAAVKAPKAPKEAKPAKEVKPKAEPKAKEPKAPKAKKSKPQQEAPAV